MASWWILSFQILPWSSCTILTSKYTFTFFRIRKYPTSQSSLATSWINLKPFLCSRVNKSLRMELTVVVKDNQFVAVFETMREDLILKHLYNEFCINCLMHKMVFPNPFSLRIFGSIFISNSFGVPVHQLK